MWGSRLQERGENRKMSSHGESSWPTRYAGVPRGTPGVAQGTSGVPATGNSRVTPGVPQGTQVPLGYPRAWGTPGCPQGILGYPRAPRYPWGNPLGYPHGTSRGSPSALELCGASRRYAGECPQPIPGREGLGST